MLSVHHSTYCQSVCLTLEHLGIKYGVCIVPYCMILQAAKFQSTIIWTVHVDLEQFDCIFLHYMIPINIPSSFQNVHEPMMHLWQSCIPDLYRGKIPIFSLKMSMNYDVCIIQSSLTPYSNLYILSFEICLNYFNVCMIPTNDLHSKIPICIWNIFNWLVMWVAKYTPSQISNLMNNDNKTKKEISIRTIS